MRHFGALLLTIASLALVAAAVPTVATPDSPPGLPTPSHIEPHLSSPPAELLTPLEAEDAQVLKGLSPAAEAIIVAKLRQAPLNQRLLRVAVGTVDGLKAALIKFQAGDQASGQFRLSDIEADAAAALEAAFSADAAIAHVDVWSVVPSEANAGGQSHRPVFSVGPDRHSYLRATASGRSGSALVRSLGVVRYDPLVLDLAPDSPAHDTSLAPLPRSAYIKPPVGYGLAWQQTLSRNGNAADLETEDVTAQIMLHGDRRQRRVAITIDDGPCPMLTPLILQVLARERAVANFFVVGEKAEQYPQLLRDIAQAGHLIGNHTYHHRRLSELSAQEIAAELDACQTVVGRLTGQVMKYLRPPGGNYTETALGCKQVRAHIITLWTHNAGDWGNPPVSQIVRRCLTNVRPGSIILMHGGDINSARALPRIIRGLRARGLEPVALPDMHGHGTPQLLSLAAALRLPENGWQPDEVE